MLLKEVQWGIETWMRKKQPCEGCGIPPQGSKSLTIRQLSFQFPIQGLAHTCRHSDH